MVPIGIIPVLSLALAPVLAAPTEVASAPISAVTVYSDRARITRTATVTLGGEAQLFTLPLLLDSIDASSVRVAAQGGDVERIDLTYVPASEFPRQRAQQLLDELTALDASIDRLEKERAVWQSVVELARGLRAQVTTSDPLRPPPKLSAGGWPQGTALVRSNAARAYKKVLAIDLSLRALRRKRAPLAEEAAKLGGLRPRSGYRITALVRGKGQAHLVVTYMVGNASWQPTYDIALQPSTGKVQLQFAGQVRQTTGEDWTDAELTLSTAVPATATRYPKVPTWTIGERERFIPTPRPIDEVIPPAPVPHPTPRPINQDELLRQTLLRFAGGAGRGSSATRGAALTPPADGYADAAPEQEISIEEEASGESVSARAPKTAAPPPPPPPPAAAPMAPSEREDRKELVMAKPSPSRKYGKRDSGAMAPAEPAPVGGAAMEQSETLGLLPAGGWVRPSYGAGSPTALAGGIDMVFHSIAKETVQSGKGARRVALLSRVWPVRVERKLFPAIAPEAYLVAELKSPEKDPLPGGEANLSVGADPAGTAQLGLVIPGASFTLPLGLDAALRPIRNVKMSTLEKGVISKDELSEYTVTIEVANPHRTDVALRVLDQLPLSPNKSVEIKLVRTDPAPTVQEPARGTLEWRLNLGAGQKTTLTFVYTLKRPKGYRLYQ